MIRARAVAFAALLFVAGCVQRTPPVAEVPPAVVKSPPLPPPVLNNAYLAGVAAGEPQLLDEPSAARALAAFRTSCPLLLKRPDSSGLTRVGDWDLVCAEAAAVTPGAAANFFRTRFDWAKIGDGKAFATGYFEPEIAGSRVRAPGYDTPVYGLPADLVRCTRVDGSEGKGRLDSATGTCLPYFSRAEIDDGALVARGLEIGWAADPVALFFLEIQGSGRLRLPNGSIMRIGYAGQNGQQYAAVGRLLRQRNLLAPGQATMAGIVSWIAANPAEGRALMRENASYVFFRELTGPGPLGALGVPVTPQGSVAADPDFIPLGAPVFVSLDRPEASGLWVAQDTGGAIKGTNRIDTFWGTGEAAARTAGGMAANGMAWVLVPRGTVARASARP